MVGFLGLEVETARQYYISRSWFPNRILSFQVINAQRALLVVYKQTYLFQAITWTLCMYYIFIYLFLFIIIIIIIIIIITIISVLYCVSSAT